MANMLLFCAKMSQDLLSLVGLFCSFPCKPKSDSRLSIPPFTQTAVGWSIFLQLLRKLETLFPGVNLCTVESWEGWMTSMNHLCSPQDWQGTCLTLSPVPVVLPEALLFRNMSIISKTAHRSGRNLTLTSGHAEIPQLSRMYSRSPVVSR